MNGVTTYVDAAEEMRGGAFAASPVTSGTTTPIANNENGDPRVGWLLVLLLVTSVIMAVGYTTIYAGVQYGAPSWGAHAYPPPLVP